MPRHFPDGFLWGAATSAHQTEGNNVNSDWWMYEQDPKGGLERSGDAVDHYHRYPEDMRLLADAGLNCYRFSVEWSRVEPAEGHFSAAALAHYRRMITTALDLGLTPVVTLQHFSKPRWFHERGGWWAADAVETFARYVERVATILDGVEWVCTVNEPNIVALVHAMRRRGERGYPHPAKLVVPDDETAQVLVAAHHKAGAVLRETTRARVGWTVAQLALVAKPEGETLLEELRWAWEDRFHEAARDDDFLGVQSYSSQWVDGEGLVPHPESPENTLTGWAYRPDALGIALRSAARAAPGVPLVVTENGIATADDDRRIAYTQTALSHLLDTIDEGLPVEGYIHWSALDNYEWGNWAPTFGLIAVDRDTFQRHPKPSLGWLGGVARANAL